MTWFPWFVLAIVIGELIVMAVRVLWVDPWAMKRAVKGMISKDNFAKYADTIAGVMKDRKASKPVHLLDPEFFGALCGTEPDVDGTAVAVGQPVPKDRTLCGDCYLALQNGYVEHVHRYDDVPLAQA